MYVVNLCIIIMYMIYSFTLVYFLCQMTYGFMTAQAFYILYTCISTIELHASQAHIIMLLVHIYGMHCWLTRTHS